MSDFNLFPPDENLLPYDGVVNDYGVIFSPSEADRYLQILLHDIPWQHDEAVMFGRRIVTARKVAWYGNRNFTYTYSGISRTALPWNDTLLALKQAVEQHIAAVSPTVFNSCLLNLYHHSGEGMAWHSDDETSLTPNAAIASLSFGATRKFAFKHRSSGEKRDLMLQHGQLIIMRGETQRHWLHAVTKSSKVSEPRVNLTFRVMRV
ncbi:alpha-ketoglutarate-dependent dioxygenase AlkB family protein [Neisseria perflava]|uniref:alpha-ketoglutarate-dependent dioxygenase AlkB family protein n=1 Tax=Neisseria perflava TaxID=33053 RepID=UPI00209CDF2D|nr:alpha-ketoglutarate-dependent dioxygenase AlkB [Neisseria perflava]MCP1660560.1 alkylated DNA repair dioxygenase AlkB [Neisseria perflava]